MINFWAREAFTIMALRKEEFHLEDKRQEANTMKRSRITIDISPELRRRIKIAASQRDLSISEYLGQILEQSIPLEVGITRQEEHPVTPEFLEQVYRVRQRIFRESKGEIFEDSAESIRQQRADRTKYLEELEEQ
jgi:predicted DNA binding CopG/RHH family protein